MRICRFEIQIPEMVRVSNVKFNKRTRIFSTRRIDGWGAQRRIRMFMTRWLKYSALPYIPLRDSSNGRF